MRTASSDGWTGKSTFYPNQNGYNSEVIILPNPPVPVSVPLVLIPALLCTILM